MLMLLVLGVVVGLVESKANPAALPLPFNQYSYIQARQKLRADYENYDKLSYKELTVNLFLQRLKTTEFQATSKYFYPSRPIESELEKIKDRELYQILWRLPKGGNLHMHYDQMLDRHRFLTLIQQEMPDEFNIIHICDKDSDPVCLQDPSQCKCTPYQLKYIANEAKRQPGWIKVSESTWTIDAIVNKTILTNMINSLEVPIYQTDSVARWGLAYSSGLFGLYDELIRHNATSYLYLKACLDSALEEHVQLIEFRRSLFGDLFYFDQDGNEVLIDEREGMVTLARFKQHYMSNNPRLIDFVYIVYGSRKNSRQVIKYDLEKSMHLNADFSDLVRGFDIVGEEDLGHTLLFHRDTMIEGFNYSRVNSHGSFNLMFHAAETNWPDDIEPAQVGDDVSTLDNVFDTILLDTKRVGHGLGFVKYPHLYDYLKRRQIAIEICPASNQILGYISDLRNHPGLNYYQSGVPIVLAGDDPGSFGYNYLTVDYYLVYMAWGLDLYDLKVIANNSIKYSIIPESRQLEGYKKFQAEWNEFIFSIYDEICTDRDLLNLADNGLNTTDLLPAYGPSNQSIQITLYGYDFDSIALCKKDIQCLFDDVSSQGFLAELNQIKCVTPASKFQSGHEALLKIKINDRVYETGFKFKFVPSTSLSFVYDQYEIDESTSESSESLYDKFTKLFDQTTSPFLDKSSLTCILLFIIIILLVKSMYSQKSRRPDNANEYKLFV